MLTIRQTFLVVSFSLLSTGVFSGSWNCHFELGLVKVETDGSGGGRLSIDEESESRCGVVPFDRSFANGVLESKVNMVLTSYGEEAAREAREDYSAQINKAVGGTLIMCKIDPMAVFGIVINEENSFFVMTGGSAYFDMKEGHCK